MKISIEKPHFQDGRLMKPGEHSISDAIGKSLIKRGIAKEVPKATPAPKLVAPKTPGS